MLNIIFNIIIYPIKLIIECIYAILSISIFKENIGISLAGLSLVVNLLCLPFYARAEKLQQVERDIQKRMANRIASIKKCFKGDERYMILSMYYRENQYHPIMAMRSSASLLIQAPFFIAAYLFLSHLDSLTGKSLFFIHDLNAPDSLLSIHSFSINVLPIIMTLINIIAGVIYSKGLPFKDKAQLYAMSLLFLALLYNSPSVLVLYWTMNNIFSLIKNILFKTKKPLRIMYFLGCFVLAAFMIYVLFIRYNNPMRSFRNKAFSIVILFLFILTPIFVRFVKYIAHTHLKFLFNNTKQKELIYILSCVCIWLLVGCFIPINLVASDPIQFASLDNIKTPFVLLSSPVIQSIGLFLFWPICLFFSASKRIKSLLSSFFPVFAFCALSNFFIFYKNYGIISENLEFNIPVNYYLAGSALEQFFNILVCIAITIIIFLVIRFKKIKLISLGITVCVASMCFLCVVKLFDIKNTLLHYDSLQQRVAKNNAKTDSSNIHPIFSLSKTGKNIIFIMLDRAINSYFPMCVEEKPEIQESFKGFIYYPNTVSFYRSTIFGAPPLFGGYEYTTYGMNARNDVPMKDKHNESLLMLPELFKKNGYIVSVTDMPYVDYEEIMDPEFFINRGINAENTIGLYSDKYLHDVMKLDEYPPSINIKALLERNILIFSILESSIYTMRDILYQNGKYWSATDYSHDAGIPKILIDNYAVLNYLPEMTEIMEGKEECFNIIVNNLTHMETFLQYPEYTAQVKTTEIGPNFFGDDSFKFYHANIAAYLLLSKWFNFLKSENVWDNTRIIIVSDHGWSGITNPHFSSFQNNRVIPYNPILLFKDFDRTDELEINTEFMTNADAPLLAVKDIIENPLNPFTGKKLEPDKKDGIYIYTEGNSNTSYYNGANCLVNNSKFYYVHDSIFESKNWRELQYKDFKTAK
jgi:membrane protein insertase Oxa1/YidC/SpoIIIJ